MPDHIKVAADKAKEAAALRKDEAERTIDAHDDVDEQHVERAEEKLADVRRAGRNLDPAA